MRRNHAQKFAKERAAGRHTRPRSHWKPVLAGTVFRLLGMVAPGPMSAWAFRLWFRTRRHAMPAHEQRVLRDAIFQTLWYRGLPVAVNSWGQGPVILLVHGWNGRGTQLGQFVAPLVAAGYRVVSFDAPAHGRTPGRSTDIFAVSAVIAALAREFGPVQGVIAHSFGVLCTALALQQGLRIPAMVGLSPPAGIEGLLGQFGRALQLPPAVQRALARRLDDYVGGNFWQQLRHGIGRSRPLRHCLIVHDRDDHDIPWQEGERLASVIPGAKFLLTQGLGHRRILKDPQLIARIAEFLAQTRPTIQGSAPQQKQALRRTN